MLPQFEIGQTVRVTRNVRNDGTFPGMDVGELLIRRGSTGYVRNIGTFLQDQIIYTVHFFDNGGLMVGCREEELIDADAPWTPSKFESREKVRCTCTLAVGGEIRVRVGDIGEVIKIVRHESGPIYHVSFPGGFLQVPEDVLAAHDKNAEADATTDDTETPA